MSKNDKIYFEIVDPMLDERWITSVITHRNRELSQRDYYQSADSKLFALLSPDYIHRVILWTRESLSLIVDHAKSMSLRAPTLPEYTARGIRIHRSLLSLGFPGK